MGWEYWNNDTVGLWLSDARLLDDHAIQRYPMDEFRFLSYIRNMTKAIDWRPFSFYFIFQGRCNHRDDKLSLGFWLKNICNNLINI